MSVNKLRIKHHKIAFTTIATNVIQQLNDLLLIGLYTYICSLPEAWEFHKDHLRKKFGIGRDKLNKLLIRLEEHGLVSQSQIRKEDGTYGGWDLIVYDGSAFKQITETGLSTEAIPKTPETDNRLLKTGERITSNRSQSTINNIYINNIDNKKDIMRPHPIPDDFEPTEEHKAFANEYGLNIKLQFDSFKAWAMGANKKNKPMQQIQWNLTFSNWLRNSVSYGQGAKVPVNRINKQITDGQETKCTIKFWEPGNPDYDRIHGLNTRY